VFIEAAISKWTSAFSPVEVLAVLLAQVTLVLINQLLLFLLFVHPDLTLQYRKTNNRPSVENQYYIYSLQGSQSVTQFYTTDRP
jgi:hypothetical protein